MSGRGFADITETSESASSIHQPGRSGSIDPPVGHVATLTVPFTSIHAQHDLPNVAVVCHNAVSLSDIRPR